MDELIKLLDENLIVQIVRIYQEISFISTYNLLERNVCVLIAKPYLLEIHSHYNRNFQDLPIQDKKVVITLSNRKMFCDNLSCDRTTFARNLFFYRE